MKFAFLCVIAILAIILTIARADSYVYVVSHSQMDSLLELLKGEKCTAENAVAPVAEMHTGLGHLILSPNVESNTVFENGPCMLAIKEAGIDAELAPQVDIQKCFPLDGETIVPVNADSTCPGDKFQTCDVETTVCMSPLKCVEYNESYRCEYDFDFEITRISLTLLNTPDVATRLVIYDGLLDNIKTAAITLQNPCNSWSTYSVITPASRDLSQLTINFEALASGCNEVAVKSLVDLTNLSLQSNNIDWRIKFNKFETSTKVDPNVCLDAHTESILCVSHDAACLIKCPLGEACANNSDCGSQSCDTPHSEVEVMHHDESQKVCIIGGNSATITSAFGAVVLALLAVTLF